MARFDCECEASNCTRCGSESPPTPKSSAVRRLSHEMSDALCSERVAAVSGFLCRQPEGGQRRFAESSADYVPRGALRRRHTLAEWHKVRRDGARQWF
jgi:hypothetical protein